MDYKTAVRELGKSNIKPVYVCYGNEPYLIDDFVKRLTDKLIDPEERPFAVSKYDLAETPLDTIIDDAETLPFMVQKKLIIATNALFMTGAKENAKLEHNTERLTMYNKEPADYSVILLIVQAEKLDERKKVVKSLKEADRLIACMAPSAEELTGWVTRQADKLGITFEPGAIEQFLLYGGTHLQTLTQELEKCSLYIGRGGVLTKDHVSELVTRTTEQNVFIMVEDLVQLKLDKSYTMLHELIKMKEEPIKILMLIARQYRILYQVKDLTRQGYSGQQIASQLSLHPYVVKLAAGQAAKYEQERLAVILGELADLDYKMKTGKIDKLLGLELFMMRLAG